MKRVSTFGLLVFGLAFVVKVEAASRGGAYGTDRGGIHAGAGGVGKRGNVQWDLRALGCGRAQRCLLLDCGITASIASRMWCVSPPLTVPEWRA